MMISPRCALGALVAIAAVAAATAEGDTPISEIDSHPQRELEEEPKSPQYVLAAIDLGPSNESNATADGADSSSKARQRYYFGDEDDETEWPTYSPSLFPTLAPSVVDSTGGKEADWHDDGWNDDGWRGGGGRKITSSPTEYPTINPTISPSLEPTLYPTIAPTVITEKPTLSPSLFPTTSPSLDPTLSPTLQPSLEIGKHPGRPSWWGSTPKPTHRHHNGWNRPPHHSPWNTPKPTHRHHNGWWNKPTRPPTKKPVSKPSWHSPSWGDDWDGGSVSSPTGKSGKIEGGKSGSHYNDDHHYTSGGYHKPTSNSWDGLDKSRCNRGKSGKTKGGKSGGRGSNSSGKDYNYKPRGKGGKSGRKRGKPRDSYHDDDDFYGDSCDEDNKWKPVSWRKPILHKAQESVAFKVSKSEENGAKNAAVRGLINFETIFMVGSAILLLR